MNMPIRRHNIKRKTSGGFTIVELLVVIVVIGILIAISIVVYIGVNQKSVSASLQSDLSTAEKRIKLFQIENSAYPISLTDCPNPAATNLCIRLSSGNNYVGYSVNNSSNPQTYLLIAGNGDVNYKITSTSELTKLDTTMQPDVTPGAAIELHALKASGGTTPGINSPFTTTWTDTSGNGKNGTLTNMAGTTSSGWATGPNRLVFDGTNDYVSIPLIGSTASRTVTFEAWVTTTDTTNTFRRIMMEDDVPGVIDVSLWIAGGIAYGLVRAPGHPDAYFGNSTNIANGSLHHVVMSWNNTSGWLAVDGSAGGTSSVEPFTISPTVTSIGSHAGNAPFWIGSIVVARIYPFALSAEQVTANYNAGVDW